LSPPKPVHRDAKRESYAAGANARVSALSYNVLARCRAAAAHPNSPPNYLTWPFRRRRLWAEILALDACIIALQDVDDSDWWRTRLSDHGYDSIWRPRLRAADEDEDEGAGVLMGWKRGTFQLVRSETVDLRRAADDAKHAPSASIRTRCSNRDDVAVMALLVPFNEGANAPSPLCVASFQLCGGSPGDASPPRPADALLGQKQAAANRLHWRDDEAVRLAQTHYFSDCVQRFNADFDAPTLLLGTLHSAPKSAPYQVLAYGRLEDRPAAPAARAPKAPHVAADRVRLESRKTGAEILSASLEDKYATSKTSVQVFWSPLAVDLARCERPADAYHISWRTGGSNLVGWSSPVTVNDVDAALYRTVVRADGKRATERDAFLSHKIGGLVSGAAYEFRVAAETALGVGPWSEASEPYATDFYRESASASALTNSEAILTPRSTNGSDALLRDDARSCSDASPTNGSDAQLSEYPRLTDGPDALTAEIQVRSTESERRLTERRLTGHAPDLSDADLPEGSLVRLQSDVALSDVALEDSRQRRLFAEPGLELPRLLFTKSEQRRRLEFGDVSLLACFGVAEENGLFDTDVLKARRSGVRGISAANELQLFEWLVRAILAAGISPDLINADADVRLRARHAAKPATKLALDDASQKVQMHPFASISGISPRHNCQRHNGQFQAANAAKDQPTVRRRGFGDEVTPEASRLQLESAYATPQGDAAFTMTAEGFVACADYVFFSRHALRRVALLEVPKLQSAPLHRAPLQRLALPRLQRAPASAAPSGDDSSRASRSSCDSEARSVGARAAMHAAARSVDCASWLPNEMFPSDHICLFAVFEFVPDALPAG